MPVELTIVESTTELETTSVEVILESSSTPGPAGPGVPTGGTDGQVLTKTSGTDYATAWEDPTGGGGASAAEDVTFDPAGSIAATDVQAALEELDTEKAAASHAHAGEDITSGTVADARIASTLARDSEVTAAIAALSTVYAALVHAHAGEDITSGTVADARIASTIARDSEVTAAIAALSSVYQAKDVTLDTYAGIDPAANIQSILGAADYAAVRALLGLVIGTNVQAWDADLDTYAGITPSANVQSLLAAASYAAMRALLDLEAGTDFPALSVFNDHSSRHEDGGGDEISVAGLAGTLADPQPTDASRVDSGAATDGQVLTADGAGAAAWETPTGGAGSTDDDFNNAFLLGGM